MKFAVLKEKRIDDVRHCYLDVIFDTEAEAIEYCRLMNDISGVRFYYSYQPVKFAQKEIESDIILRIENIANCLNLADICLMKRGSRSALKASHWFNLAKERSKIAADLLEVL